MMAIRWQKICRVVYRDAKGRFIRPPERPARVERQPVPKEVRVHKGGEVVAIKETRKGVRVRFVPDRETRRLIREAKEKKDYETLRQIRDWEREVTRLAAEDYLRAKRAGEWSARMEAAQRSYNASKGGKTAAANRKKVAQMAEKLREETTPALVSRYRAPGGSPLEKRVIAMVLKERGIDVAQQKKGRKK
ncbi:hypothetical protein [Thermus brockianus]